MEFEELNLDETDSLGNLEIEGIQKIKISMKQFYSIWHEIGIDKGQKIARAKIAWCHIQNLIQDIYEEEHGVLEELKKQIIDCTKSIEDLSKILSVEVDEIAGAPLIKRAEALNQQLNDLKNLKVDRVKKYESLRETEQYYCKLLDMEEHKLSSNAEVPSEIDLNELDQYICMMKQEEIKRRDKYLKSVKQLLAIYEETGLEPETKLEKHILSGKNLPDLSTEILNAIENAISNAMERKVHLENKKKILLDKLTALWDRLKMDDFFKSEFLSKHTDCKAPTIKSIEQELIRCEELKMQNIKLFIDSIRQELQDLWEKCGASDSEKQSFHQYSSTEMSDALLADHEKEIEIWKAYYEEVKPILEKIEKRNKLWNLLMALDSKANDPSRYKNRGGNLLKEERERNKLQKTLPALENEIYRGIEMYEAENGNKFFYLGEDYRSHIVNQWQQRSSYKENIKHERHLAPRTPGKRPEITTPKSAPCIRNIGQQVYRTPSFKPKFTSHTVKKPITKQTKGIKKYQKDILSEIKRNSTKSLSNDTTYTDFAKELNRTHRQIFRSSVVASKKPGGTRIKTPNKNKRKSATKPLGTSDNDFDLTSVRGKSGLPFVR